MDFTYVEFPCTVSFDIFKAYFNPANVKLPKIHGKSLTVTSDNSNNDVQTNQTKSLRHLVLDCIVEYWSDMPIFAEIPRKEDRNYILSNLDVNISLKTLSANIQDDFFWEKCYFERWKTKQQTLLPTTTTTTTTTTTPTTTTTAAATATEQQQRQLNIKSKWINIYMERHLQEFIENCEVNDYDLEIVQTLLDICAPYINQLEINCLQPSMDDPQCNDHIPLDYILNNLPELHTLRLTYCTKTVGINFYLGCNQLSQSDTFYLSRGLTGCYELINFCFHGTKLEPYQLGNIARSLDKCCHKLTQLALINCSFGDEGLIKFLEACNKESFTTLKVLDLRNNRITADGAYTLSRVLTRLSLETLILRMNPIQSDGAAALFNSLSYLPITFLDIAGCSITETITKLFMQMIVKNKTLKIFDIANNNLGENFGKNLYKIIGFNKTLQFMDMRNTGMSLAMRNKFKDILELNMPKVMEYFQ